jgi:integral membrane protein
VTTPVLANTESGALLRYRAMAYLVGTLLVVLVLGVIINNRAIEVGLGTAHGYLYMVLLITIADLWRRRRFPLVAVVLVALAGTIPFLSFYAERQITARVTDGRW